MIQHPSCLLPQGWARLYIQKKNIWTLQSQRTFKYKNYNTKSMHRETFYCRLRALDQRSWSLNNLKQYLLVIQQTKVENSSRGLTVYERCWIMRQPSNLLAPGCAILCLQIFLNTTFQSTDCLKRQEHKLMCHFCLIRKWIFGYTVFTL